MDINRLTERAQEALRAAQSEATRLGHQQIDVEHLLLALLEQEGGLARSVLDKTGVDAELVRQRLEAELARLPKISSTTGAAGEVYITGRLNRLLVQAEDDDIKLTETAATHLACEGYDPVYGARPLKRAIQKELETPIGRRLLAGEIHDGDKLTVDWRDGVFTFSTKKTERAEAASSKS